MREHQRQASGLTLDELMADYEFLRLGDLISLAFCTGSTDVSRFSNWTIERSNDRVVITPDPFGGAVVPIEVTARVIPRHAFPSEAALHDAMQRASLTIIYGEAAGRAAPESRAAAGTL